MAVRRAGIVVALAALAASWISCSSSNRAPAPRPLSPSEIAIRTRLGVPLDAKQVVVFAQNAHLDVDWQKTFDDYYTSYVGDILTEARQILDAQPRASYSIAEMAYLEQHVAAHPEELAPIQAAAARGQFHVVGGGMTSPDTLLPETEMLVRDYLYGDLFAENVIGVRPRTAWLPDSFGHSATAPDVLSAAGYEGVMFGRIDGAESLFEWLFHPHVPPKPGSTLEQLVNLGTADFVWRGAAGGTILAHYVSSGLYCTGDNIDYDESLQVPGGHTGTLDVAPAATDAKIDGYVTALAPFAKTPYVFVPVGCDFQHPKDGLVSYMDGYNARRYPTTGAWAVAATFDDYEDLVGEWRDVLPELQVDLTPYYMGFYGSRADVKQGTRSAARPFFEAETFATALGDAGAALMNSAAPDFELLTRTDHHDFVTGTSADDVVANEQLPLLAQEQTAGATALAQVASAIAQRIPAAPGDVSRLLVMNPAGVARSDIAEVTLPLSGAMASSITASAGGVPIPFEIVGTPTADATSFDVRFAFDSLASLSWLAVDVLPGAPPSPPAPAVALQLLDADGAPATGDAVTRVILSNANVRAQWDDGAAGFGLTSLVIGGNEAIAAPSFFPRDYADMGGLWRTGNEMSGCSLTPVAAAVGTDTVEIVESTPLIAHVAFHSTADPAIREAWLGAGAAGLDLAITTGAQQATTRTVTINFAADANAELVTSLAAGYQKRPLQHVYTPTFWPAVEWAAVGELEPAQGASWAILLRQSTGVLMSAPGAVELMAARDARAEQCDVEGGMGSDTSTHHIEWRIERVSSPADAAREAQAYNRPIAIDIVGALPGGTLDLPVSMSLAQVDGDGILSALKPAERGGGVIVRALLLPGPVDVHLAPLFAGRAVTRTDALERDQSLLGTAGATLMFGAATSGSLATVRLE